MAITGPIYWNGTNFPSQDSAPVAITQTEFEDCCCGDPCTDCSGTQPSATVSTFGCSPASTVDGTYTYQSFTSGDPCVWHWQSAAGDDLYVRISALSIVTELYGNDGEYFYSSSAPTLLSCISGVLTGDLFTYRQPSDGCTAVVTLG